MSGSLKYRLILMLFLIFAIVLWLSGIFLLFLDVGIFIPSESYKIFSYSIAFFLATSLVYILFVYIPMREKQNKNYIQASLLALFGFIVVFHFYLVGFFHGFPGILQFLNSTKTVMTKNLVFKYYHNGQGGKCYNSFTIEDSFYFGRVCTDKETLKKLNIGDEIVLYGHKNVFGFYSKKFKYEKHSADQANILTQDNDMLRFTKQ